MLKQYIENKKYRNGQNQVVLQLLYDLWNLAVINVQYQFENSFNDSWPYVKEELSAGF